MACSNQMILCDKIRCHLQDHILKKEHIKWYKQDQIECDLLDKPNHVFQDQNKWHLQEHIACNLQIRDEYM